MIPVITLLVVILWALCVTRIASEALVLTGMSRLTARFQARSAYTGTGFTTTEAEQVVRHPLRRKMISFLMLAGNIGFMTIIGSTVFSFSEGFGIQHWGHGLILIGGMGVMAWLAFSKWADKRMIRIIGWFLKRYVHMHPTDYNHLMHISEDYGVSAVPIPEESWLVGRSFKNIDKNKHGFVLLGIESSDGSYNGAPYGNVIYNAGDVLIVYGPMAKLYAYRDIISLHEEP